MKNLFDREYAEQIKQRLATLQPDSPRQWGSMTAPQAMAHCSIGIEIALGELNPPRVFIGRLIGGIIKPLALGDDKPIRKNAPTAPVLLVKDDRDLTKERARLMILIDRFASGGPNCCTTHPHAFFGAMTADQWAILMYKHLDHHLRQFGA